MLLLQQQGIGYSDVSVLRAGIEARAVLVDVGQVAMTHDAGLRLFQRAQMIQTVLHSADKGTKRILMFMKNSLEHADYALESVGEGIDLFAGVIEGEGGADGAADAEAVHQGLRAVVAGAHGNAEAVE